MATTTKRTSPSRMQKLLRESGDVAYEASRGVPTRRRTLSDMRPRDLDEILPDEQPYHLYCKGYTYRQIAAMIGINKDTVMKRVKKVAAERAPQSDQERAALVQESVDSLRLIKAAGWKLFEETGDSYVLVALTGVEERIAKVRGLITNSSRVEVSGPGGGSIPLEFVARTAIAEVAVGSIEDSRSAE